MKVNYIIHGERPNNGIIKNQVLKLFDQLANEKKLDITVTFFCNFFIYYKNRNSYLKLKFTYKNLKIKVIPLIIIPERFEQKSYFVSKYLSYFNLFGYFFLKRDFDILITRSYNSSFFISLLKSFFSKSNLIFDPRSLYPLERYDYGYFSTIKLKELWLKRESQILKTFNKVISVSFGMTKYFNKKFNNQNIFYLPFSAKKTNSKSYSLSTDVINAVYVGSLDFSRHNDPFLYKKYCEKLISFAPKINFIFVSSSINNRVKKYFLSSKLLRNSIKFYSGSEMVEYWLSKSDFGIYFMKTSSDSFTRIGVKSIEYISSGLPIVHNNGVGGIKDHINNKYLINLDDGINRETIPDLKNLKNTILNEYSKEFSYNTNIVRLSKILDI